MGRYDADWLHARVLKVAHHGSSTTSPKPDWINTVQPEAAIISCGYENGFGHPRKKVVGWLMAYATEATTHKMRWALTKTEFEDLDEFAKSIYSTATNCNIVVKSDGADYGIEFSRN
jgi:hypothetical protein